ncbi:MAG: hypothetical protein CL582_16820 [Alteromonadaceae bacterium]|nr:hypothetical protein [Alteromonadaceae bacterium]|tara:strand:- start:311 stop:796 length:486 start_codon:yes stop_codon:yes gene_type:complete
MFPQDKNSTLTTKEVDDFCRSLEEYDSLLYRSHRKIRKEWQEFSYNKLLSMNSAAVETLDIPVTYITPPFAVLHFKCWLRVLTLDHNHQTHGKWDNYMNDVRKYDLFKPSKSVDLSILEKYFLEFDEKAVTSFPDFISYLNSNVLSIDPTKVADDLKQQFA